MTVTSFREKQKVRAVVGWLKDTVRDEIGEIVEAYPNGTHSGCDIPAGWALAAFSKGRWFVSPSDVAVVS